MKNVNMEYHSEAKPCTLHDSLSTVALSAKSQEDNISQEEQTLFRTLEKAISEATEENNAFAKEISTLLTKLGLKPNTLTNDIKENLSKVTLILRSERLRDLDDTALQIVQCEKEVELQRKRREEKKFSLAYDDLSRKYTAFTKELDYLHNSVKALENNIVSAEKEEEDRYTGDVQLTKKLEEYQKTVKKLEVDIDEMQIKELYPEKILNKYNKYLEVSAELVELNGKINQYEGLPANILQAKILLAAKQKEYETLEKEFLEKLNS